MAVPNAGDQLFGPLMQALSHIRSERERGSVREEQRRRYDEEKAYQKRQDLKRERGRIEDRLYSLGPEELGSGLGRALSGQLDEYNRRIGDRPDLPGIEPISPEPVDRSAFDAATTKAAGLLERFARDRGAQGPAVAPAAAPGLMGPSAAYAETPARTEGLSVPRLPEEPMGPPSFLGPDQDLMAGLEGVSRMRSEREAQPARERLAGEQQNALERLRMLESLDAPPVDLEGLPGGLADIQEAARQRAAMERLDALRSERLPAGEQMVREAIEARMVAPAREEYQERTRLAAEEAAKKTAEARKEAGPRKASERFVSGLAEGRKEARARKEFNAARDTLVKGLMQYGAHGESLVAALHKYENKEYGLRDLMDHWKKAVAEVDAKDRKKLELDLEFYKSKLKAANRYKKRGKGKGGPKLSSANRRSIENRYTTMSRLQSRGLSEAFESQLKSMMNMAKRTKNWIPGASGMSDSELREAVLADFEGHVATVRAKAEASGVPRSRAELTLALRANQQALAQTTKGLRSQRRRAIRHLQGQPSTSPAFSNRYDELVAEQKMLTSEIFERPNLSTVRDPTTGGVSPPPSAPGPVGSGVDHPPGTTEAEQHASQSLPRTAPPAAAPAPPAAVAPAPVRQAPPQAPAKAQPPEPPYGKPIRPAGAAKLQRVLSFVSGDKRKNQELAKALIGVAASRHPIGKRWPATFLKPRGEKMTKDEASVANDLRIFINELRKVEEASPNHRISLWNRKGQPFFKSVSDVLGDLESWGPATSYQMLQSLIPPKEGR